MKKTERIKLVTNYNYFYILPTLSVSYEMYEGSFDYFYIDLSFLKWTLSFVIKKFEYQS